jgi:hypothetical protein
MVTLEDIENEIDPTKQSGIRNKLAAKAKAGALNEMIRRLKKQEDLLKEIPDIDGKKIIRALINGDHHLSAQELDAVSKKFGTQGLVMIDGLAHLNTAQKQWIFKQMGWNINEVK